jgi:hypothetical protein
MRHLEITTYIGCPNMCEYCPQDKLIKSYKGKQRMDLEDFKQILKNIPSDVEIHFSGFSELFFHPQAVEFLQEAFKSHQVVVYTTTKGMTDEVIEAIKAMPFKLFVIHDIGGYKQLPFQHHINTINDDNKISRAGSLWQTQERQGICTRSPSFEQNVVLPNGDVYLCCMDYGLKHKLGNLYATNFNQLERKQAYEICKNCESFK